MKEKANHNGHCLYCGKESKQPFCNRECYRAYVKGTSDRKEQEKQQRNSLTDRIIKRTIYIGSKGKIKYNQITPEMIIEKRAQILACRERKANPQLKQKLIKYCKICGKETPSSKEVYCSDECRKEKVKRDSFKYDSAKKILKSRQCKECGNTFTTEYGNKRREFCSGKCAKHNANHNKAGRKDRARARYYGVDYEYINPIKVFERDGWICQICLKPTPKKNRGTYYPNAPELDHRIPISKGGSHTYLNVQCCCRKCNGSKSNKNEAGQINLFQVKSSVYRGLSHS